MTDPTDTFDIETADPGGGNDPTTTHQEATMTALIIRPTNILTAELLPFPEPGTQRNLDWMYDNIGCRTVTCITPMPGSPLDIDVDGGLDLWGDEEGLCAPHVELNGTVMLATGWPEPLVGTWIITRRDGQGGATLPLTSAQIDTLIPRILALV